jgi:hypothetical protein
LDCLSPSSVWVPLQEASKPTALFSTPLWLTVARRSS